MRLVENEGALRLVPVAGQKDLEPVPAQNGREHPAQGQVVVDDEHPLPLDIGGPPLGRAMVGSIHHGRLNGRRSLQACSRALRLAGAGVA